MATVTKFEELEVWKKARGLSKNIHQLSQEGEFSKDFGLKNQINRATGSVMDNIAEGFERNGKQEFIQFLAIAKGSVGEVRSQLYRAFDRNYLDENNLQTLLTETESITKMIHKLIEYLNRTDFKGQKYIKP